LPDYFLPEWINDFLIVYIHSCFVLFSLSFGLAPSVIPGSSFCHAEPVFLCHSELAEESFPLFIKKGCFDRLSMTEMSGSE